LQSTTRAQHYEQNTAAAPTSQNYLEAQKSNRENYACGMVATHMFTVVPLLLLQNRLVFVLFNDAVSTAYAMWL
jgi:hypothetical protein